MVPEVMLREYHPLQQLLLLLQPQSVCQDGQYKTRLIFTVKAEPVIKQEPSYADYPSTSVAPPDVGVRRAGQYIQEKFGTAANGSLNALQSVQAARVPQQQAQQLQQAQTQPQLGGLSMAISSEASRQAYNRMLAEQMQQQKDRVANQQRSVASGQTDGVDEWRAYVAERRALTEEAVVTADTTLRQRIEQIDLEMEGGGLMLPASQIKKTRTPVRRNPNAKQSQVDGADSDDDKKLDDDEDAINSDLDDPDDDPGVNSEEEGNNGEVMLCLYDKVQRVKNKWKCTLKDGVLSTGGKEYVLILG